jgi:predicted DNA-binding WGR domain protein
MKKIVLISKSEGSRGQAGKKKIYEIVIEGNKVTFSWGKAEEAQRQTQTKWFATEWSALNFANEKKWAKVEKGYEVAFTA